MSMAQYCWSMATDVSPGTSTGMRNTQTRGRPREFDEGAVLDAHARRGLKPQSSARARSAEDRDACLLRGIDEARGVAAREEALVQ